MNRFSIQQFATLAMVAISFAACTSKIQNHELMPGKYIPDDQALYNKVVALDSIFFNTYNNCSLMLDAYADFYAEDVEFYHDKGGFSNSKKDVVEGTKNNVCGKVTRHLVPGSIEVYPIKDYGAIEFGFHYFRNNQEPDAKPHPARFVIIWKQEGEKWKIKKVVSLH
ncbi:MAG: nuclear transport factor 2 family protein [Chitinophagaceae bacterium]|uniref:nuclear transport factor 2 family protein n=1 Tax=unclassified Paraflavitalea TaxID=2798305 RepID=UPI003D33C272|nr:nuclear transport factor 2 family protein [Chitinophagaceae bacterium]